MADSPSIVEKESLQQSDTFKMLLDALKGYQASALDSGYKGLGFMVVALGWLVTSEGARGFLGSQAIVRWAFVTFLILSGVCYGFMSYRVYALSRSVARRLAALDYSPPEVYEHYVIKRAVPIIYTAFHLLISALMCVVVLNTR